MKTTPDSVYDLAADFKSRGLSKYVAWDQFIIARGLKPEINAKDFYDIYESISPKSLNDYRLPANYKPTHRDTLMDMECQIDIDAAGVQHIVWANGHTGSNPPGFGLDRFLPLVGGAS